jgi:hypothetical protein
MYLLLPFPFNDERENDDNANYNNWVLYNLRNNILNLHFLGFLVLK